MVSKAVSEYLDYATVHGFGRLKNAPYKVLKLLWVLCLFGSFGMIIFQMKLLVDEYKSKPISTSVVMKNPATTEFPVVTICNTNPINRYLIPENSSLADLLDRQWSKYMYGADLDDNATIEYNSTEEYDADILWSTTEQFELAMNQYTHDEIANMSQTQDEFILVCTYNGEECSNASIQRVRTYEYGICYSIFPELQSIGKRTVSASGKRYGLQLLLSVDQYMAIPFVTQSNGIYVMTHQGKVNASSIYLRGGVIVPSGQEVDLQISKTEEVRVPGSDESDPRCNDVTESLEFCLHDCQQKHIAEVCGCIQYFFDYEVEDDNETYYGPCNDEEDYRCLAGLRASYIEDVPPMCAKCRVPCYETLLKTDVSLTTWPTTNFIPVLKRILSFEWGADFVKYMEDKEIWDNLVMVNIYLSTMSYQSTKEEYSYSEVNLISDIGGTLGLWAGFSILSIVEVLELFFLLGAKRRQEMNERNSVTQVTQADVGSMDNKKP